MGRKKEGKGKRELERDEATGGGDCVRGGRRVCIVISETKSLFHNTSDHTHTHTHTYTYTHSHHTHTHVQWRTKDRGLFNWLNILKQGHQSSKKPS